MNKSYVNEGISEDVVFRSFAPAAPFHRASEADSELPPFPPGGFLEPYYTIAIEQHPLRLMPAIFGLLQKPILDSIDVDFEPDFPKFKFSCTAYRESNATSVQFCIRLFRSVKGAEIFEVEFQRRAGDFTLFVELFRMLKLKIAASLISSDDEGEYRGSASESAEQPRDSLPTVGYCSLPVFDVSMLPPLEDDPRDVNLQESMSCLVKMATSEFVDIKIQGMQALVQHVSSAEASSFEFLNTACFDLFFLTLKDKDAEVRQAAATGIMHLLLGNSFSTAKFTKNQVYCDALMAAFSNGEVSTPQLKRVISRTLLAVKADSFSFETLQFQAQCQAAGGVTSDKFSAGRVF